MQGGLKACVVLLGIALALLFLSACSSKTATPHENYGVEPLATLDGFQSLSISTVQQGVNNMAQYTTVNEIKQAHPSWQFFMQTNGQFTKTISYSSVLRVNSLNDNSREAAIQLLNQSNVPVTEQAIADIRIALSDFYKIPVFANSTLIGMAWTPVYNTGSTVRYVTFNAFEVGVSSKEGPEMSSIAKVGQPQEGLYWFYDENRLRIEVTVQEQDGAYFLTNVENGQRYKVEFIEGNTNNRFNNRPARFVKVGP